MVEQKIQEFTDSTLFPQDWNEKSLDKISIIDPENLPSNTPNEYLFNYITIDDIQKGFLKKCSLIKFKNAPSRARKKIQFNDILLSTVRPNLQSHFLMDRHDADFVCSTGFSVIRCHDNIDPKFVYYHLFFQVINKQIQSIISGSNYPAINSNYVKKLKIPIPTSKKEQEKISKSLTDIEKLINSVEFLIQKKKNIKQGVMQELLTGKRRLEGFSGEWETKTLDEICIKDGLIRGPFGGNLKKEDFVNFGYKVYEQKNAIYKNISDGNYFVDENKFSKLKRFSIHSGDFILSCSGTIGKLFQIPKNAPSGIINQALLLLKINRDLIDEKFFTNLFEFDEFQKKIIDNSHGGAMQNLVSMNNFKKTSFQIPSNKKEQDAIAKILSDMDSEIGQLEKQLEKYTNLRQAMMQKLLTGEIRLV